MNMMEHKTEPENSTCGGARPGFAARWLASVFIMACLLVVLKPFIERQMLLRAASYFAGASYGDAIRLWKRVVYLDGNNVRVWTSLACAYEKNGQEDEAVAAYNKAVSLRKK